MRGNLLIFGTTIFFLISCGPSAQDKLAEYTLLKAKQQDSLTAFLKNDKQLFELGLAINAQEKLEREYILSSVPDNSGNKLHLSEKQISENIDRFNLRLDSLHSVFEDRIKQNDELRAKNRSALSNDIKVLIPVGYSQ